MPQNNNNRNTRQDIHLARLEEKVDQNTKQIQVLSGKVNNWLTNHFPSLRQDIGRLEAVQKLLIALNLAILAGLLKLLFG